MKNPGVSAREEVRVIWELQIDDVHRFVILSIVTRIIADENVGAQVDTYGARLRRYWHPGWGVLSTRVLLLPPAACSILVMSETMVQGLRGNIRKDEVRRIYRL